MARKARRYFRPRRAPARAQPDDLARQTQLDAAAAQLANQYTLFDLQGLLAERQAALEAADQAGTHDPSPINLARYRRAQADWEVTRRAVELAGQQEGS